MAQRKAARRAGRTGITSSSQTALGALPIYKRNYVKARAEGKSIRAASIDAGVSKQTGRNYERESLIQQAYRELMIKAIPPQKLVNLIKGGCEAKMPIFSGDGKKVSERADWRTRRPYIEMAAKHAGYHEDKTTGNGTQIVIAVSHIGQSHNGGNSQRIVEASTEAN